MTSFYRKMEGRKRSGYARLFEGQLCALSFSTLQTVENVSVNISRRSPVSTPLSKKVRGEVDDLSGALFARRPEVLQESVPRLVAEEDVQSLLRRRLDAGFESPLISHTFHLRPNKKRTI